MADTLQTTKGFWIRKHLRLLATIQVQDAASAAVLSKYNLTATVTGDPRIDRVLETANQTPPTDIKQKLDALAQWKGGTPNGDRRQCLGTRMERLASFV